MWLTLKIQLLHSLGKYLQNFQTMELKFRAAGGRKVVLRGMANGTPKMISAKHLERIFRHGDVAWITKCLITSKESSDSREHYHVDI